MFGLTVNRIVWKFYLLLQSTVTFNNLSGGGVILILFSNHLPNIENGICPKDAGMHRD